MNVMKKLVPLCLTAVMTGTFVMPVWAASDVTRTEEEWAKLRDNTMEYGELDALIHEYNVTVLNNRSDYFKSRNRTQQEISDSYRNQAQELYDSIQYPDGSDETAYAMAYANALQLENMAKSLEKQADENVDDGEIRKISYDQVEDTLVSSAQTQMNAYHQLLQNRKALEANIALVKASYDVTVRQYGQNMVTQADVHKAEEQVKLAEASLISLDASIKKTKQSLCLMTGWSYDASPEIVSIPTADTARIAAMNPEADLEAALKNNYSLRSNRRKLDNTESSTSRETLENTIKDAEQQAGAALNNQYRAVLQAKADYDQAVTEHELEAKTMETAQREYNLGMTSAINYMQAQAAYVEKETNRAVKDLALSQAMTTYDWAVKGLLSLGQ